VAGEGSFRVRKIRGGKTSRGSYLSRSGVKMGRRLGRGPPAGWLSGARKPDGGDLRG